MKLYKVGGFVRDKILRRKSKDIDYAVETSSFDEMRQGILNLGGRIFQENEQFFTIRASVPTLGACDFVYCRKEGPYSDGRRPDWVKPGTIYDDLARRDFTMNAIALDMDGNYIDPHDGLGDISKQTIRCVGSAEERLQEDGLRVLRAIRFSAQLEFGIDSDIRAILNSPLVSDIIENQKIERIRDELEKGFRANTKRMLSLLNYYPYVTDALFANDMWLLPTMKKL